MNFDTGDKIKFETSGLVPKDWALVLEKHERFVSVRVGKHEWSFDPDDPEDFVVTDVKKAEAAPRPAVEPGDKVRVDDETKYRDVLEVFPAGAGVAVTGDERGGWVVFEHKITDVYTKAEQQANGALVHYAFDFALGLYTDEPAKLAVEADLDQEPATFVDWQISNDHTTPYLFLTPEATAALGEFHPVPDRAIKTGDVVRDQYDDVFIVDAGSRMYAYDAADDVHERPISYGDLSLVAKEDPAYRGAKERGEEPHDWKPTTNTLAAWVCTKCDSRGFSPHPLPKTGCKPGHYNGMQGWIRDEDVKPDPAPQWQSWPDVVVADGEPFHRWTDDPSVEHHWRSMHTGSVKRDDQLAQRAPVRRAVVVTLPDAGARYIAGEHWGVHDTVTGRNIPVRAARAFAAELLAAALHAEERR